MDWKQVLPPLCRSRIETRFAPAGEDLPAGSSKFGGRPDVPAGFVWPVFETKTLDDDMVKPRPLAFDHATGQGEAFPTYCYEVAIAEVSVDTGTGAVTVDKITVAHDLGTVINPGTAMGQIYGGIVMGMGFALMEEVEIDRGIVKSKNLDSYIIPTAMDIPEMDVTLYECDDDQGTYGAKSLGEPATEAIGAAVASAVSDALGRLIKRLPADLERVKLGRALRPGGED